MLKTTVYKYLKCSHMEWRQWCCLARTCPVSRKHCHL